MSHSAYNGGTATPKTLRVSVLQPEDEREKDPKQGAKANEGPIEEAISWAIAMMHRIKAGLSPIPIGPILMGEETVDGSTTKAPVPQ